jgi:hypothetical protein
MHKVFSQISATKKAPGKVRVEGSHRSGVVLMRSRFGSARRGFVGSEVHPMVAVGHGCSYNSGEGRRRWGHESI